MRSGELHYPLITVSVPVCRRVSRHSTHARACARGGLESARVLARGVAARSAALAPAGVWPASAPQPQQRPRRVRPAACPRVRPPAACTRGTAASLWVSVHCGVWCLCRRRSRDVKLRSCAPCAPCTGAHMSRTRSTVLYRVYPSLLAHAGNTREDSIDRQHIDYSLCTVAVARTYLSCSGRSQWVSSGVCVTR